MRLSTKQHWNAKYEMRLYGQEQCYPKAGNNAKWKRILGGRALDYMRSYDDYLLWDVLYPKYMPKARNAKVLEIGSAPGNYLVRLNKTFGFIPYGVEYSESGVELNRRNFVLNNLDPSNVIYSDFFSSAFHEQYAGYFDIVVSRGFIEHFSNAEEVIAKHLNLLNKGGYLFVTIPNYRGINYLLQWIFNGEILQLHQLDIMDKIKYSDLFKQENLLNLYCDYWGTFNFGLFYPKRNRLLHLVYHLCGYLQLLLNISFRTLFKDSEIRSRFSSPHLIFIGQKKM
jgi:SAM-dependent methyltransferase